MPEEFTFQDLKTTIKNTSNQNTRANKGKSVRQFLRFLGFDESIVKEIPIPQPPIDFKEIPNDEDVKRFIEAIPSQDAKVYALLIATAGLRPIEAFRLTWDRINLETGFIQLKDIHPSDKTKIAFYTFCNDECLAELKKLKHRTDKIFRSTNNYFWVRAFATAREKSGVKITPQLLRSWHAEKLERLGMREKYIEFLQGKVPRTTLRRHYSDYSISKIKAEYDRAGLKVLS